MPTRSKHKPANAFQTSLEEGGEGRPGRKAGTNNDVTLERQRCGTNNLVVVDDGIYFTNPGGTLDSIDFKTMKARTVCKLDKGWAWGLSISPDHRWILCSLLEEGFNDLMLAENFR